MHWGPETEVPATDEGEEEVGRGVGDRKKGAETEAFEFQSKT